jgi:hypothetical protein
MMEENDFSWLPWILHGAVESSPLNPLGLTEL